MRRAILSLLVATSLAVVPRPSLAAEPEPTVGVAELQAMHGQAQAQVERYNVTHDASLLTSARELLARWLVEHQARYGDTAEAKSVRAPIEQQLGMIDAELLRVTPPAPAVAPAPPPKPPLTPQQNDDLSSARVWTALGASSLGTGALTMVAVSLPLWLLRDRALRRADEQRFYVDEQRFVSRARRRHVGAIATFAIGAALAGAGVAMLTVGGVKRARVRRELSVAPELGRGFAGASATLRF